MRIVMMLLAAAVLASPLNVLAQGGDKGKVLPYYYYVLEECPGRHLEVTTKSGQKISGKFHAQLADRFQVTRKGMTYDVPYTSIAIIKIRRSWFEKLKGSVLAPYRYVQVGIGMAKYLNEKHGM